MSAVDPSEPFVAAIASPVPGGPGRASGAERVPFADGEFDAALAQLVVHFMTDPVGGLREMARVTRPGGVVAACVWDHAGGADADRRVLGGGAGARSCASRTSHTSPERARDIWSSLFGAAGLREVEGSLLTFTLEHPSFDDWWEPLTLGVGPAGAYAPASTRSGEPSCAPAVASCWPEHR